MKMSQDPYRPPQIDESGLAEAVPTWRVVLGVVFRLFGAVLVAIPLVAVAKELFRSGLMNPSLDFGGIVVVVVVYTSLGGLLFFLANKISPGRRLPRKQDDQLRDI